MVEFEANKKQVYKPEEPKETHIILTVERKQLLFVPVSTENVARILRISPIHLQSFATRAAAGKPQTVARFKQRDIAETIVECIVEYERTKGPFIASASSTFELL